MGSGRHGSSHDPYLWDTAVSYIVSFTVPPNFSLSQTRKLVCTTNNYTGRNCFRAEETFLKVPHCGESRARVGEVEGGRGGRS